MNKHVNIVGGQHHRVITPMRLAPRKYTAEDIFFFLRSGLFDQTAKFELFEGEIIPMSPKGANHEATRVINITPLQPRRFFVVVYP